MITVCFGLRVCIGFLSSMPDQGCVLEGDDLYLDEVDYGMHVGEV